MKIDIEILQKGNDQRRVSEIIRMISFEENRFDLDGSGAFQSQKSKPIDRSMYSKQRLFSVEKQEEIGLKAKRILDWGRIEYLQANGFDAHLKVYATKSITLENIALIATPTFREDEINQ